MRPTTSNNIAFRCRTGCRTTTGELFTHTLCPSALEARKRLCFLDLFLVVSPATVALEYLFRGLSVCRVGCCLSHKAHYAGFCSRLKLVHGLDLCKFRYQSPPKSSKVAPFLPMRGYGWRIPQGLLNVFNWPIINCLQNSDCTQGQKKRH